MRENRRQIPLSQRRPGAWLRAAALSIAAALAAAGPPAGGADATDSIQRHILAVERSLQAGRVSDALPRLLQLQGAAERDADRAAILLNLSNAYFLRGDLERSLHNAEQALELADELRRDDYAASAINTLGNIAALQGRPQEALAEYDQAIELAEYAGRLALAAEASINAGRAALALGLNDRARELGARADKLVRETPQDRRRATIQLALGKLLLDGNDASQSAAALDQFDRAVVIGKRLDDPVLLAQGHRYLAILHERAHRPQQALNQVGKALYAALGIRRDDILYRLQWQAGRLLRALGQPDEALNSYRQAVATLQRLRSQLTVTPRQGPLSFAEFGGLYYELADLLLQRSAETQDRAEADRNLLAARDAVEQLKTVELADYFRDDCITESGERQVALDRQVDPRSATLYPIVLPQRLELLLSLPGRITRFSVPVAADRVNAAAKALRSALESGVADDYLPHARRLYDWLIRPLEQALATSTVDTLVFVPDGALRLVPLAVLNDGERFLVERHAIATSPALVLTDPKPLRAERPEVLLSGLSRSVQGYPALPAVSEELVTIRRLFGGTVVQDQDFVKPRIRSELERSPYTIVHIATHGEFETDVRKSYLLTFDSQLTMDELERFVKRRRYRIQPVELLTLSACRTAVGDERAALGLAGIALKAGARSAVATLWSISDEATAQLVPRFYRHLMDADGSKAKALQRAQRELLAGGKFAHPAYWGPFLLVGNWL